MLQKLYLWKWALIALLAVSITACGVIDIQKPQVKVADTTFQHVSLQTGRLDTRLSVLNPNTFGLPIKALRYQLILNDLEFANGTQEQGLKLAAGESRMIDLPIDVNYKQLLGGIDSIIRNKRIQFRLKGELDFGLMKVPFRETGEFSL